MLSPSRTQPGNDKVKRDPKEKPETRQREATDDEVKESADKASSKKKSQDPSRKTAIKKTQSPRTRIASSQPTNPKTKTAKTLKTRISVGLQERSGFKAAAAKGKPTIKNRQPIPNRRLIRKKKASRRAIKMRNLPKRNLMEMVKSQARLIRARAKNKNRRMIKGRERRWSGQGKR